MIYVGIFECGAFPVCQRIVVNKQWSESTASTSSSARGAATQQDHLERNLLYFVFADGAAGAKFWCVGFGNLPVVHLFGCLDMVFQRLQRCFSVSKGIGTRDKGSSNSEKPSRRKDWLWKDQIERLEAEQV